MSTNLDEAPPVTILNVEDDPAIRSGVSRLLQSAGFRVREAATGDEALRLAATNPDLIILDIQLPGLSGFEVCRRLKSDRATAATPILLVSAVYTECIDKAFGLDEGADGYLFKPVEPVELFATVRALLRIREAEEALRRANEDLERRVGERTAELVEANQALRDQVAERQRAEAETRRLAAIVENSEDAIVGVSPDGVIENWNAAAERIYGYRAGEVLGKSKFLLVPPDRAGELPPLLERVRRGERVDHFETERARKDGKRIHVSLTISPIRNGGGAVTGASMISRDITERKQAEAALRDYAQRLRVLSRRLLEVQEEERRHLARELHDDVGQLLHGLGLTLESAGRLPEAELRRRVAEVQGLVRDLIGRVRELSLGLRPAVLDDLGLLPALGSHFERFTAQTQVAVHFTHAGLEGRLPNGVETAAFRLVQEALTNVARHAGVAEADVRVRRDAGKLRLEVEDKGKGFDLAEARSSESSSGLSGMQERAELLGGYLDVRAKPGEGTRLVVELPLGKGG